MNQYALRMYVRSLINEAKEKADKEPKKTMKKEDKAPKSSGKLVDLKKELAAKKEALSKVEEYRDNLQAAKFAEKVGGEEFAEKSGFAKELNSLNAKGIALEQDIENTITKIKGEITSLEEKTLTEINKIKEMMGLEFKEGKEKMVDEARFKKGTDIGKKGPGFAKIEKSAAKKYGSEEAGKRVAGAILKKVVKK